MLKRSEDRRQLGFDPSSQRHQLCGRLRAGELDHRIVVTHWPRRVEHDFTLATSTATVASGSVTFNITNQGPSAHDLLAFRTDMPEDQLPLGPDGRINEDALPKLLDTQTISPAALSAA